MKSDTFSERPYFPFCLCNGNDTILVNYSGAMICGVSGHNHNENNQGAVCGWYKEAHREKTKFWLQPLIILGYNAVIDGEICEPMEFCQEFLPEQAMLVTQVAFRRGVKMKVTSFLTADGVFCLETEVLKSVPGMKVDFVAVPPNWVNGTMTLFTVPEVNCNSVDEGLDFTYHIDDGGTPIDGRGVLRLSRPGFEHFSKVGSGVRYSEVGEGWKTTAYFCCKDAPDAPVIDYTGLRERHIAAWKSYFDTLTVKLPDSELQYAYELSRYIVKGNQFSTGALPAGPLPYHWGGGVCCPFDSALQHHAFLQSGNFAEALRHVMFYANQADFGHSLVAELGLKGIAFSNWSDVFGNNIGQRLKSDLLKRKPLMIAVIGMACGLYNQISPVPSQDATWLTLECAQFIESGFVRDGKITRVMAGNESDVEVDRDSWMLAACFAVFKYASLAEPGNPRWRELADNMLSELRKNLHPDGYIMPYQGAGYSAGTTPWTLYDVPELDLSWKAIEKSVERCSTPWGLDSDQPSEVCRHWPWNDCLCAKAFAEAKAPEKAFFHLKRWFGYASSNGAIPEKIRIDGYAIGYWYVTPYALYLLALYSSFAHFDNDGRLCLLYGFDGSWRDLSIRGLRLPGGVELSMTVRNCEIVSLDISGSVPAIDVNPAYRMSASMAK